MDLTGTRQLNAVKQKLETPADGWTATFFCGVMVTGYLNALLRTSSESQVTLFRALLPLAVLILISSPREKSTGRSLIVWTGVVASYSLVQLFTTDRITDVAAWSYLANGLAAIAFIHIVRAYRDSRGASSLHRHLFLCYQVIVILSVHQLITGFVYPHAEIDEAGYAPIWYNQRNDASLALAAFVPLLFQNMRRRLIIDGAWLVAGIVILYINDTRGVLVGVATYLLIASSHSVFGLFGKPKVALRFRTIATVVVLAMGAFVFREVKFPLSQETATINELVLLPLLDIASGTRREEELTSINVRVTTSVVGLERLRDSWGFGIGPGASFTFVRDLYDGIARSMHVFPLQLLVEWGWLFVAGTTLIMREGIRNVGAAEGLTVLLFFVVVSSSITSGAITNYYFFACGVALLTPTVDLSGKGSSGRSRYRRLVEESAGTS